MIALPYEGFVLVVTKNGSLAAASHKPEKHPAMNNNTRVYLLPAHTALPRNLTKLGLASILF